MIDTQHLPVTGSLPSDPTMTPSERGHRHKRSFAISGDFDFLKQPVSLPPLPCVSPEVSNKEIKTLLNNSLYNDDGPEGSAEPKSIPQLDIRNLSPSRPSDHNSALSPRFFISEEPKFSSPFSGVPDAIINLDDALKTKPKSFKSHRRSESAPADLSVLLNPKTVTRASLMIEEEEDADFTSDSDCSATTAKRETIVPTLMSPLRPSSPSRPAHVQSPTLTGSPVQTRTNRNGNFNSLKINRQKQRYYHYTKKLPVTANSTIQPQTLKEQTSSSSLSSACVKTPLSLAHTPSKQIFTPSTPLSSSHTNPSCNDYQFGDDGMLISPLRPNPMYSHKNLNEINTPTTTFKYEPKVYDMPHGRANSESVSSRDDRTLYKKEMSFADDHDMTDEEKENCNRSSEGGENRLPISRELLFGEPGDAVDLSSFSSSTKEHVDDCNKSSREASVSPVPPDCECPGIQPPVSTNEGNESRSVSDSAILMQGSRKDKRRMRSRLNVFFMNIFKYNNEDDTADISDRKT